VFDKVRENTPSVGTERGDTYSTMVNRSMNQVLMRSLNTSFVALLPVASLLVVGSTLLGGLTLRDFALALFVGLAVGAYSSIFVATPLLAWMKEREPRYRAIRERALTQRARDETAPVPAAPVSVEELASLEPGAAATGPPPSASTPAPRPAPGSQGAIAPRPRQQRRRKRR